MLSNKYSASLCITVVEAYYKTNCLLRRLFKKENLYFDPVVSLLRQSTKTNVTPATEWAMLSLVAFPCAFISSSNVVRNIVVLPNRQNVFPKIETYYITLISSPKCADFIYHDDDELVIYI